MRTLIPLVASILCLAVPAQEKLGPRSFAPDDYGSEVFVDMARLVQNGAWDTIERTPARALLATFRKSLGFDLGELTSVRGAFHTEMENGRRARQKLVWSFAGEDRVALGGVDANAFGWVLDKSRIGDHDVLTGEAGVTFVSPRPGLLVVGDTELIDPVLRGERRGGVPASDLVAIAAGKNIVAYMAGLVAKVDDLDELMPPIPGAFFDGRDLPQAMALRIVEDPAAGSLSLACVLRFETGEHGPALFQKQATDKVAGIEKDRRFAVLRGIWGTLAFATSGRDLTVSVDLGTTERATGTLVQMAFFLLPLGSVAREEQVVEEAVLQDTEVEEATGKGEGKGKGEAKGEGKGKGS